MNWVVVRKSRRNRGCDSCLGPIHQGDLYRSVVTHPQPYGDLGNAHWWRIAECADCARRYGRPIQESAA